MDFSRRDFIVKTSLVGAGISVIGIKNLYAREGNSAGVGEILNAEGGSAESVKFNILSKTLQWLDLTDLANCAAELGFDGIDLTVRPDGHVVPEKVEDDLPKAVEAAKKAGVDIKTIVTSINNVDNPLTEKVLNTASLLGISSYRMDWLYYDDTKSIEENLATIHSVMDKIALLNEKYKIRGEYQNHSGKFMPDSYFGSSLWDLYWVLKNVNSPWLGFQFDIMHAIIEGAYSWETDFKLLHPFINSIVVKDYLWEKDQNTWKTENVPLGTGMVDFRKFLGLIKQFNKSTSVSLHCLHPLGGAEWGSRVVSMKREEILSAIKKDLVAAKLKFKESNLIE